MGSSIICKKGLPSIEAVIFDMDGVLVDSEPLYTEVERANFRQLGLAVSEEEHKQFRGTATDRMWQVLREKYNMKQSVGELVEMTNRLVTPYFRSMDRIEPMPGIVALIKKLKKKGILLALASSSYSDVIDIILRKTGLKNFFDVVVDSQMAGSSKPDPDIFLLAAEKLGVSPDRCIVIEDSTNGIKAARDAGMFCIAYAGPGSELQDQSGADMVISRFKDFPAGE
jgi:beta-phosphoglucomutase